MSSKTVATVKQVIDEKQRQISRMKKKKKKQFNHKTDNELEEYCRDINQKAFISFALIIVINLIFFVIYGFGLKRWLIFPLTEYFIFDIRNDLISSILFTLNWILLICVISTQVRLQEMHIDLFAILKAVGMFFCLNIFGTINSILIMYPIVTILNYTYYYKFKSRMRYFINNLIIKIDPKSDQNDKFLRLIAINHFLSKLCYKLQTYSLKKRGQTVNNMTVYHKLHQKLDIKLNNIQSGDNEFRAENVYKQEIEQVMETQRLWHRITFRCYAASINLSMIRCLFYSENLNFYNDHYFIYTAFWGKLYLEFIACIIITIWAYFDEKLWKIKQNELKTRFYYIVLKSPEYKRIDKIIYNHLLTEADKFYQTWKYSLDGPFVRRIVSKYVGRDVAGTVCQHIFEMNTLNINKNKNYNNNNNNNCFYLIVLHLKTYSSERSERVRAKRGVVKRRA